eukprot:250596_1
MVDCTDTVFHFIKRWKWLIMIFWIASAIGCCFFALDLPNQTVFQFLPPSGSESDIAYQQMNKYFPDFLFIDVEVVLIQAKWDVNKLNKTILQNNNTQRLVSTINDTLWYKIDPNYKLLLSVQSYYDLSNVTDITNISYHNQTYPINIQQIIDSATSAKYIDSNGDTMLVYIQANINDASTSKLYDFINDIKAALSSINHEFTEFKIVLTGGTTIFQQAMQVIQNDITSKDLLMLPLIFMIMIYMIGSWKLVVLPGACLGMTIVISFGIFYPFSLSLLQINPMAPSIMMFLSMALSIDYSMFLLSRFSSELRQGKSVDESVRIMLRYSAHVVILSGTILIICYIAIIIFPISGMETVGYGAAISIFCCMIINITMTASSILAFPNYYGTLETFPTCLIRCVAKTFICCPILKKYKTYGIEININSKGDNETWLTITPEDEYASDDEISLNYKYSKRTDSNLRLSSMAGAAATQTNYNNDEVEQWTFSRTSDINMDIEQNNKSKTQNIYFILTQYTTRCPFNILCPLIIYAFMIPAIFILMTMQFSIDFTMNFPKHVESVDAYNVLINDFNPGDMAPFYILVTSKNIQQQGAIWDINYFNSLCIIGSELSKNGFENITQMTSIGFVANIKYNNLTCFQTQEQITAYETMINHPELTPIGPYINTPYWIAFMKWFNQTVNNPNETVSIILAIPNFNPFTNQALDSCINYRNLINSIKNRNDIKPYVNIYLHQSLYWEIDGLHRTNEILPYGLAIIIGIVFLLIGIVFKTIFLPFRLLLCIVIPILFVYGLSVGVFQNNWLGWTQFHSLQSTNGIGWMLPVITCTVLVGLALDYEIFLFSRVFEYRSKGYTISASIILG